MAPNIAKIVAILKPSSTVFAEIGNGQEEAVSEIARSANLSVFKRFNDLSGVVRCLQFVRKI